MVSRAIAAFLLVLAGCGDDAVTVVTSDGRCGSPCDPLAAFGQQGCNAGMRCTAVKLSPPPTDCPDAVVLGCRQPGTRAIGEPCIWGAPGFTTGYDNCVTGAVCASDSVCRAICGLADGSPPCAGGLTCFPQAGLFEPQQGGDPVFGVCAAPP